MTLFLNIIEIFGSIQGETTFAGLPTTFIRLAACNLRCTWCDTTYSFKRGEPYTEEAILSQVDAYKHPYVCVTGGEPLLQKNVHSLMRSLCDKGYTVTLETGGSLSIKEIDKRVIVILDIKAPGSGMDHKNEWSNLSLLKREDEVKFVLLDRRDYDFAKDIILKHDLNSKVQTILLSPVHGKLDSKELVEWMLKDKLAVRLNLQLHKFVWSPETKGV